MKIEISHDTLAKKVYEKASAEDRMRLRVINFIKAKHHFFEQERVYLTAEELKFIAPFENQIDLLDAEKNFITRSKWLARKQMIIFGVVVVILFFVLSWFLIKYIRANKNVERINAELFVKNKDLEFAKDSLSNAKDSIEHLVNFLLQQDSIQDGLRQEIQDRDNTINMTREELEDAWRRLQLLNKALEKSKNDLEKERDKLKRDNTDLVLKLKGQVKTDPNKTNALEQSQKLSQQARAVLESSAKPTDNQYQEAFKLARAAWELNNNNNQAMDVLNEIKNVKIQSNNGGFLNNTRPKYTYTQSQIESMIKELDKKYNYGKLNPTETKLRLNTK